MHQQIELTRQELFERVWSTPLLSLAKEIGVSDVAIGKACRRAGIPLPGRGYWAQTPRSRQKQPKLPTAKNAYHDTIRFTVADVEGARRVRPPSAAREAVVVEPSLVDPHPLVSATLKLARSAKTRDGRLVLDYKRALFIRVSPDQCDRALRILDALIKASERMGATWRISADGTTQIVWGADPMKFVLTEKLTRKELPLPPRPKSNPRSDDYWSALGFGPRYELVSTGLLSLGIEDRIERNAQRNWNDTARRKLEVKLADVLAGMPIIAAAVTARREEREAQQRIWAEQERRAREKAIAVEKRRRLREQLVGAVTDWERSSRIRAFCDAAEARIEAWPEADRAQGLRWLAWARKQADALDAIANDLPALVKRDAKLPEGYSGPNSWERVDHGWWA